jgi:DNA polymerase III epsilon subunit-like protein
VIIGHNIGFDLEFLKKFFPSLKRKSSIDTFRLSQTLLHYVPSYALEVLVEILETKPYFQEILQKVQPHIAEEENFHDAYFDSKLTIALFWYLVKRVELLTTKYPILKKIISQSSGSFSEILFKDKDSFPIRIEIPSLKKISPSNTQMIAGDYQVLLDEKED